jgi:hypothetical protein
MLFAVQQVEVEEEDETSLVRCIARQTGQVRPGTNQNRGVAGAGRWSVVGGRLDFSMLFLTLAESLTRAACLMVSAQTSSDYSLHRGSCDRARNTNH